MASSLVGQQMRGEASSLRAHGSAAEKSGMGIFRLPRISDRTGDMSKGKCSPDYEHMKAKAPRILSEMVHMLVAWQKMGFHVPRGVKNIFEFTWDELMTSSPRKSFSGLYCPVVHFVSFDEEPVCFTSTSIAPSRIQKTGLAAPEIKPNYVSPSFENQEMLHRFQQKSVHLLTELLKIKMKIMINAVAGPSTVEIARRFLEGGQQLSPKTPEEASEIMTREPKKKGRAAVQMVPAIAITSTTQLIQQLSFSCLCFSLSFKDSKAQKDPALPKGKDGSSEGSIYDPKLDPCPQARERLREICRNIEKEKAESAAKGHTRPLILRNYSVVHASPSVAMRRFPSGIAAAERRFKGKKFYFAFPDGTSFLFYPTGHVAVCQFPICCLGKTITLLFQDGPTQTLLGTFTSQGQCCVGYSFKCSCSIALLMNQEGGSIRDKDGYLTHRWSWYSKKQLLRSLEFQITEHLKLSVRNQHSMTLTFTSLNETITLSLSRAGCPHRTRMEKRSPEGVEQEVQWHKVLAEIKKRFEKTVRQFINGVLMASGICCIEYPVGPAAKHVKFSLKEPIPQAWDRRLKEQASIAISESKEKAKKPGVRAPPSGTLASSKPFKLKLKHPSQPPGAGETHPAQDTWASCPADCPIMLRKVLAKEEDITCCKCVVKIPLLTDVEFEKFVRAARDPDQVLVICVLSPQNPSYSPYFEWSLEKIYIQMQHGRPSPCVQCKHDPFRFLKYDLDSPLNKKPPLLVQKHGVVPGMVVMYAGGKLLFGGCVFNGYSYSKRDLLKQINQVRLDYKMGHFLPQSFKFSPTPTTDSSKKPGVPTEEERAQESARNGETPPVEIKKEEEEFVVVVQEPEVGKKAKRVTSGKKGKRKS
ncbi:uncharacterized protein C3orf20 homolog [Tiliqua scincoides]|uniref:uncharacterized protein C3orf20 homolog n=1 Tax=Tiliqua scincoides TaxID=71010 RepID=UPI0034622987